jgi:hypothetical protein
LKKLIPSEIHKVDEQTLEEYIILSTHDAKKIKYVIAELLSKESKK